MTANKAILAAVAAGLTAFVAAVSEQAPVSYREWILVVLSAVVAGLTVYLVPNKPLR